jgi:hypothetical protein
MHHQSQSIVLFDKLPCEIITKILSSLIERRTSWFNLVAVRYFASTSHISSAIVANIHYYSYFPFSRVLEIREYSKCNPYKRFIDQHFEVACKDYNNFQILVYNYNAVYEFVDGCLEDAYVIKPGYGHIIAISNNVLRRSYFMKGLDNTLKIVFREQLTPPGECIISNSFMPHDRIPHNIIELPVFDEVYHRLSISIFTFFDQANTLQFIMNITEISNNVRHNSSHTTVLKKNYDAFIDSIALIKVSSISQIAGINHSLMIECISDKGDIVDTVNTHIGFHNEY